MGKSRSQLLIAELRATVADLAKEAQQGSEPARQWCIDAFPGHVNQLLESWFVADERPPAPRRPRQRSNGEQQNA